MPLSQGTRLGNYEILGVLGAGGMGEVYRARDTRLQRPAAIKVITAGDEDKERVRRLEQEALAASALNHPNILTVYELGAQEGLQYIATELVEGQTLRDRLKDGPVGLASALAIATQIAAALEAAHAAGIVHRDIKPENVMIRPDAYVKVLDFGIAKLIPSSSAAAESHTLTVQTVPGMLIGTVGYMAPEQIRGLPVDHRADVWSIGVVLHEMLAGRSPFAGPTTSDVIAAVLERTPPTLATAGVTAPAELERIIGKALEKDRDARYQSMSELAQDLRTLEESQKYEGRSQKAPEPSPANSSSYRPLIVVAMLIAIAAIAWFTWSWTRSAGDRQVPPAPAGAGTPAIPAPPAAVRSFQYWLTVQPLSAGASSIESAGADVFRSASRFRFNFTNPEPGFVYVLNETSGRAGVPILTMLYPTPSLRGGSAGVSVGSVTSTGDFRFDPKSSVEHVWIVWSSQPHQLLERAKRWVNSESQGRIRDGAEAAQVFGLLGNAQGATARTDESGKRMVVSGGTDPLIFRVTLQSRP